MALTSELSFPWPNNAVGDGRAYTDAEWARFQNDAFLGGNEASEGILRGLAVTGTSSPLTVASGSAIVKGVFYNHGVSETGLTVSTPSVGTTGGVVVVQYNRTNQQVRVAANRNTDGVNSTPALTQTSTVWEIPVATFTITTGGVITVTDARGWAHFSTKVSTAMIEDSAVTAAKIPDGAITSAKIADGTIATADLANDSVDDTKVGNRVPQFYRRQGGNATSWVTAGTTDYTPTAVRIQGGVVSAVTAANITFPAAFSAAPFVLATCGASNHVCNVNNITSTGCIIEVYSNATGAASNSTVYWLAIGPE